MAKKISTELSVVLDFMRGISAQLVLIGHLLSFYSINRYFPIPLIQNFGVLVFFILSGFLITQTTLLKIPKKYNFPLYFVDRFSRIYYTYFPALVLIYFLDYFLINKGDYNSSLLNWIENAFMLQSFPSSKIIHFEAFGSARPFWTVSIEWWIYIFFGFIFYKLYQRQKISFFSIFFFIVSIPLCIYYIDARGGGLTIYWILGLILSLVYNQYSINIPIKSYILILCLIIFGVIYRTFGYPDMYDLGIALFLSIFIFISFYPPKQIKAILLNPYFVKFSRFVASFSYSLYLLHYTLIVVFLNFFPSKSIINLILVFIVSNIISYIFYLFFEKNHYKFRKKLDILFFKKTTS